MKKFVLSVVVAFPLVAGLGTAQAQFGPMVWQQPSQVFVPSRTAMPVTRVYRAPIVKYQPTRQVVTRQRPFLGGSVSRATYGYRRVVF